MERTMKVTGRGRLAVKPDQIRLTITQHSIEKTYDKAVQESADKKGELNAILEKLGFEKSDLKTLSFGVNTEYESYQARDKSWQQRLKGYSYTHRMKIEFVADNKLLGRVLRSISRCTGKPEFRIEYTIADKEAAKNALLAKAVADSRTKAEVLANASGVKLGDICSIDYSWGEIEFVSRPMRDMAIGSAMDCACEADDGFDFDIEADDINVTDTVTIIWGIA